MGILGLRARMFRAVKVFFFFSGFGVRGSWFQMGKGSGIEALTVR